MPKILSPSKKSLQEASEAFLKRAWFGICDAYVAWWWQDEYFAWSPFCSGRLNWFPATGAAQGVMVPHVPPCCLLLLWPTRPARPAPPLARVLPGAPQ